MADAPHFAPPKLDPRPEPPRIGGGIGGKITMQQMVREMRARRIRAFLLITFLFEAAMVAGWLFPRALAEGRLSDWLLFLVALLAYFALLGIAGMVFSWKAAAALSFAAIAVFLMPNWGLLLLQRPLHFGMVMVAAGMFHFLGSLAVRRRLHDSLRFHATGPLKAGAGYFFFGFAVLSASVYFFHSSIVGGSERFFIRENTIANILGTTGAFTPSSLPLRPDMTVDDALGAFLKISQARIAKTLSDDSQFRSLPEEERNRLLLELEQRQLGGLRSEASTLLGQKLSGGERAAAVLEQYLESRYRTLPAQNREIIFAVWTVFVFFFIWSLGKGVGWGVVFVGWILIEAFLAAKLVGIRREPAERHTLIIP